MRESGSDGNLNVTFFKNFWIISLENMTDRFPHIPDFGWISHASPLNLTINVFTVTSIIQLAAYSQRLYGYNRETLKSHWKWPSKNLGIFEFLEFLKVAAYDSTIGPHNIYIWEKFISCPLLGIMGYFCRHVRITEIWWWNLLKWVHYGCAPWLRYVIKMRSKAEMYSY